MLFIYRLIVIAWIAVHPTDSTHLCIQADAKQSGNHWRAWKSELLFQYKRISIAHKLSSQLTSCKVALSLAKILSKTHSVTSVIRNKEHEQDIKDVSATPLVLSLEDAPASDFSKFFKNFDLVYFAAGASGKGGEERTKKVDYEGAVKIFDAIEGVDGPKPRLILVSAIDIRNPEKTPAHYVSRVF